MISSLPMIMVQCLAITVLIEVTAAAVLGLRKRRELMLVALVNVMTNPIVVSVSYTVNVFFGLQSRHIAVVFLELFALVCEALIYSYTLPPKKLNPFLLSLILNACSFLSGLVVNAVR